MSELNGNYPSAKVYHAELLADLEEQQKRGWIVPMTLSEALNRFDLVSVAPMSVLKEQEDKFRVLYDGSNKVRVNHRIKVVDSEQLPSALDVQAVFTSDPRIKAGDLFGTRCG